jgi:hypothetical protein
MMPRFAVLLLAAGLAVSAAAQALREPHIAFIYPAGVQRGTTCDIVIGGQYLDGAAGLYIHGGDLPATVTRHYKFLTPQQLNGLRNELERLDALEAGAKTNAAQKAEAARLRTRLETTLHASGIESMSRQAITAYRMKVSDPKKQLNPALSEAVHVRLVIPADAPPGEREIRVRTPDGLSNPLVFHVGVLPEHREKEPNDDTANIVSGSLPTVVNGQILPGDVDRFRFPARKGERLVAAVAARALIPYLADAVPGWFQATLALFNARGEEVAYTDDFRFSPDPVLCYEIPEDGDYTLEIKDCVYRGREDFVYRVTLGAFPFVTDVFPPGGPPRAGVTVRVDGWNLPGDGLKLDLGGRPEGIASVDVGRTDQVLNRILFAVDAQPAASEKEPDDDPARAQRLGAGGLVDGRIGAPGDEDVYRIDGKAGDRLVAEILARRLNSPLDSALALTRPDGTVLAANDDCEDKGCGLITHHADSRLETTLPADGAYFVRVRDTQGHGGEDFGYRLRVGPPRPDFELRVTPSAINARTGDHVPVTVYALRRDGFAGDIALALPTNAPAGFRLSGGWIPAGQDKVRLTLSVPAEAQSSPVRLALEGRAAVGGRTVLRRAVPAEDMMQAFFYRHLVPSGDDWLVSVIDRGRPRAPVRLALAGPVKLPRGGGASVNYTASFLGFMKDVQIALSDPPEGITLEKTTVDSLGLSLRLRADEAKTKAGLKGNLIVEAFLERVPPAKEGKPKLDKRRIPIGALPAIPFEITAGPG